MGDVSSGLRRSVRLRGVRPGLLLWPLLAVVVPARADDLGSAVYVRTDSDRTTVVSPHLRFAGDVGEHTQVEGAYVVDVWSSASIDIRTSATPKVRVTEQRDEVDLSGTHELDTLTLGGGYRYSQENDYRSHGLSLSASQDLASRATTVALSTGMSFDEVRRAGYPQFSESLQTGNARLSLTQILDPSTLAQLNYELIVASGYQASPYRYVAIGGGGTCAALAPQCAPERVPDARTRHAVALQLRRALGKLGSLGAAYRIYQDDWALSSHTIEGQGTLLFGELTSLTLGVRYYTQGAVDFYQRSYAPTDDLRYLTRDRELSPLSSLRVSAQLERRFEWGPDDPDLRAILVAARTGYVYDDFVGLDEVTAYELTFALGVGL